MGTENELDPATTVVLEALGTRIRAARETAGMIQQQLADVLDVTQAAVSRWESGERDPGVADLIRIADALGVQAASLLPAEPWVTPPAPEPDPRPEGFYGRVELPGYRHYTGWITDEERFGQHMCVVSNWDGVELVAVIPGPNSPVLRLPTPLKRPEPVTAITAGPAFDPEVHTGWAAGDDGDDPDGQYRDAF
jgi:transcriptional regulator with XRE-family HTH domain